MASNMDKIYSSKKLNTTICYTAYDYIHNDTIITPPLISQSELLLGNNALYRYMLVSTQLVCQAMHIIGQQVTYL